MNTPASSAVGKVPKPESILLRILKRFSSVFFKYFAATDMLKASNIAADGRIAEKIIPKFSATAPDKGLLPPSLLILKQHLDFIRQNPPEGILDCSDESSGHSFRLYYNHQPDSIIGYLSDLRLETEIRRDPIDTTGRNPITKLPMPPAAEGLVDAAIRRLDTGEKGVFFLFDLDDFPGVIAEYGQTSADSYLRHLSSVLRADFRSGDVVGQLDDYRFFVFFTGRFTIDVIEQRAQHLVSLLQKVRSESISAISSYLGVSVSGSQSATYASLCPRAQKALEIARRRGKNRYCMFDE